MRFASAKFHGAQSVQEKQTKKPKKRQSKTKLPVYLGKSLKLVERGVYDDMLGESGILLETGMFNVVETFGNGGIRAMRPSDIEDALEDVEVEELETVQ